MQNKKLYFVTIIILVLVVVGFIAGPIISTIQSSLQSAIVFGRYRGQDIVYQSNNYFGEQLQLAATQFQQLNVPIQPGDDFTSRLIWRQAYDNSLNHVVLLQEAQRLGVAVPSRMVDREVAQSTRYQTNGQFDVELYRSTPRNLRLQYRSYIEETLIIEEFMQLVVEELLISDAELELFASMDDETRQVEYAVITIDDIDIASYISDNPQVFRRVNIDTLTVTGNQQEAQSIRDEIDANGTNFTEVKNRYLEQDETPVDIEGQWYFIDQLERTYSLPSDVLDELAAAIDDGTPYVSPSIQQGEDQYIIFTVLNSQSAEEIEYAEVEDYAGQRIAEDNEVFDTLVSDIGQQFNALPQTDGSLSVLARDLSLEYFTSDFFPLNYGNSELFDTIFGDEFGYLERIGNDQDILQDVFSMEINDIGGPYVLGDYALVVQLADIELNDDDGVDDFTREYYHETLARAMRSTMAEDLYREELHHDNFDAIFQEYISQ